ncbi:MAG TPA: hypothetical protein VFW27_00570 [Actinoplanes sp.]|jgi:predicted nucleotidyltransferase|nr:hypothetical protein [Actinoplanes sp.]
MRSFNASTAADLEPVALVLAELSRRASECGVEIMVVGATARDILIRHVVGSVPERATADIDVAVAVNVFGFREAMAAAVHVTFPGNLVVPVASLPAQSVLKILAWQDRHHDNRRDAIDLKSIITAYHEGPYLDQLYVDHQELVELHEFDPRLAGAHRIGREARSLLARENPGFVTALLDSPEQFDLLAADMGGLVRENRSLLLAYSKGFAEPPPETL